MPEYLKQLPEPQSNIAKDSCAHISRMLEYSDIRMSLEQWKEKHRIEQEGLEELDRKYPNAGFRGVLKMRQQDYENQR